jgi:hypothetical protein
LEAANDEVEKWVCDRHVIGLYNESCAYGYGWTSIRLDNSGGMSVIVGDFFSNTYEWRSKVKIEKSKRDGYHLTIYGCARSFARHLLLALLVCAAFTSGNSSFILSCGVQGRHIVGAALRFSRYTTDLMGANPAVVKGSSDTVWLPGDVGGDLPSLDV